MKTYTKTIIETKPRLVIQYDSDPESPREWSNLGYFITCDSRHYSPDRHERLENIVKNSGECARDLGDHIRLIKENYNDVNDKIIAIYPVNMYKHGQIMYSLGSKHGFDYSNNGFYIVTKESQKELGTPKKLFEKVINSELKEYNAYANGEVYGYTLYDEKGEIKDSCWGFCEIDDIKSDLPEEWQGENLLDYFIN